MTIIVLLILAGVSLNAIIGDNGIITQAMNTNFVAEMTDIQEALNVWKAQYGEDKVPSSGLAKTTDVLRNGRIAGEICYYRVWAANGQKPELSVNSESSKFNDMYLEELNYIPRGIEDLYYLDTEAIGVHTKNKYIIDASNSMFYSINGYTVNNIKIHSLAMYRAINNGDEFSPKFEFAEVNNSWSSLRAAGNTESEYLMNENGDYVDEEGEIVEEKDKVKNPNYNEYGFRIIASPGSQNVFKLYNNGDLYGKGVKGDQLNTSPEDMNKINVYDWKEANISPKIKNLKKIFFGYRDTTWFIDGNDDVWVLGDNSSYNECGLNSTQLIEYTGLIPVKVDIGGKKAIRVFSGLNITYILVKNSDNQYELLGAGMNNNGQLGIGDKSSTTTFEKITIPDPEKIKAISNKDRETSCVIILYNDGRVFFSGWDRYNVIGRSSAGLKSDSFIRIWNGGTNGPDIDDQIEDVWHSACSVILTKTGDAYSTGYSGYYNTQFTVRGTGSFSTFNKANFSCPIRMMGGVGNCVQSVYVLNNNGKDELWFLSRGASDWFGTTNIGKTIGKITLPKALSDSGIKKIVSHWNCYLIYSNDDKLYGIGNKIGMGLNDPDGKTDGEVILIKENVSFDDELIDIGLNHDVSVASLKSDEKILCTGSSYFMFGEDILQKNWVLISKNVADLDAGKNWYLTKDHNLYVCGYSAYCGIVDEKGNYYTINNYIKLEDENLIDNIKKVYSSNVGLFILDLNNSLWTTGDGIKGDTNLFRGWGDDSSKKNFVKILDNVVDFACAKYGTASYTGQMAICSDGKLYSWGNNYGTDDTHSYKATTSLPAEVGGVSNIKSIGYIDWTRSYIITKDGKLFVRGNWDANGTCDGGNTPSSGFSQYSYGINSGEKVTKVVSMQKYTVLILMESGNVYGYGRGSQLGKGIEISDDLNTSKLDGLSNIDDIIARE